MTAIALQPTTIAVRSAPSAHPTRWGSQDGLSGSLPEGKARVVAAKEHVFCEGDPARHVYRVEAGYVCVYRVLSDGRRQVIMFALPGDVIGLGAHGTYKYSAQAGVKTRLTSFGMAGLRECARRNMDLGLRLYEALADELAEARELLLTVGHRSAGERLAAFLVSLVRRDRRRGGSGEEIVLPMTRTDIADFLGLTIETVSRTFTKFRAEGLIDLEQCVLVTIRNADALERAAGATMSPPSRAIGKAGAITEPDLRLAS